MRLARDLGRRKLRSGLTITGIAIGIMALVVFGSMANKMNTLISGGSTYYKDKLVVSQGSMYSGNIQPLSIDTVAQVEKIDGVDIAVPSVEMVIDDKAGMSMGVPPMISGVVAGSDEGREHFQTEISQGRKLTAADEGTNVVVMGSDLATKYNATVGGTINLRGTDFTIVGILQPTFTAPDQAAEVPLIAAQKLFLESLPPLVKSKVTASEIATSITVYPKAGVSPETIKERIGRAIPGYTLMTGKDFDDMLGTIGAVFSAVLFGIALLSLAVGGLSTINTMAMSVAERTREIGIKRAIGASRWRIRREIVLESAAIGLISGLLGLIVGASLTYLFNEMGRASGNILFLLTPQTALLAVGFATGLGALAGFIPAWHASRLDPVAALRYE
jgi:putative ABC transport system permease protein